MKKRPDFFETHEPAKTNHFRIVGNWGPGYRVAPQCNREGESSSRLGWLFHTTSELEYLLSVLIEELNDLMRQIECDPDSCVLHNRHPLRYGSDYISRESQTPTGLALRFHVLKRDGYRCQICGRNAQEHDVTLEVDHRVPRARGDPDDPMNLWTLCFDCNRGKSDSDL